MFTASDQFNKHEHQYGLTDHDHILHYYSLIHDYDCYCRACKHPAKDTDQNHTITRLNIADLDEEEEMRDDNRILINELHPEHPYRTIQWIRPENKAWSMIHPEATDKIPHMDRYHELFTSFNTLRDINPRHAPNRCKYCDPLRNMCSSHVVLLRITSTQS
eukprot:256210_1